MDLTTSIGLLLLFIIIFLVIIEIFTVLFRLTGLTSSEAKFQVISMLTNCGFTTLKSELIMKSRLRQRLAMITILFGYSFTAIFVSAFINMFLSWNSRAKSNLLNDIGGIAAAFLICIIILELKPVKRLFDRGIQFVGMKILYGRHVNTIMLISEFGDKTLVEVGVKKLSPFLKGKPLIDLDLKNRFGILILLIRRKDRTMVEVDRNTRFEDGDTILAFGNYDMIQNVFMFSSERLHNEDAYL